jgi:hypothetical protein
MKGETMLHHKKKNCCTVGRIVLVEKNHEVGVVETRNICKAPKELSFVSFLRFFLGFMGKS